MKRGNIAVVFFCVLLLASTLVYLVPDSAIAETTAHIAASRTVYLQVKIVFVGIDPSYVDTTYLSWNENLPATVNEEVLSGGIDMQVTFNLGYEFAFTSDAFSTKLTRYLSSISDTADLENLHFTYFGGSMNVSSTQYDANKVEQWFIENSGDFGGMLEHGWTFIVMYLPELPSATYQTMREYLEQDPWTNTTTVHPHYYRIPAEDQDLGYKLRYREFATAWGNHERLWFVDLSAGPSWWDTFGTFPLQVAIEDQNIELGSTYGRSWLTEYLADYIWGGVENFAVPSSVYYPVYTERYDIVVTIFDARTGEEQAIVPVEKTINADLIKQAFEDLVPYATTSVKLDFEQLEDHPELARIVKDNTVTLTDAAFHSDIDVIELRPIYSYLQTNLRDFVSSLNRNESEFTIPLFALVASGGTTFTYSNKWDHSRIKDPEKQAFVGVALGDIAVVISNQWDFTRGDEVGQEGKGIGMSNTVIHELGHMVGLMHPHQYDDLGDFSYGVMGYYTHDYGFGQSDKDFIRRAHTDQLLLDATGTLERVELELDNKIESPDVNDAIAQVDDLLNQAETEYSNMDFTAAVRTAIQARTDATSVLDRAAKLPLATELLSEELQTARGEIDQLRVYIIIALVVGVAAGFAVAYIVLTRRSHREGSNVAAVGQVEPSPLPASQVETLTPPVVLNRPPVAAVPSPGMKFCTDCGKPIPQAAEVCILCGGPQQ